MQIAFILITLFSVACLYYATGSNKKLVWFYLLWLPIIGVLSYTQFFTNTNALPPRMAFVLLPVIAFVTWAYKIIKPTQLNAKYLIALSVVRIPVELALHKLYVNGQVPVYMTFEGWNFDILSGISALLLLGYLVITNKKPPRIILLVWNTLALTLLLIIVVTALLSAPSPIQRLAFSQPNIAILYFPYTFLPAVIVPAVLLSHLLLFKMLKQKP